jgi:hypothetical protein
MNEDRSTLARLAWLLPLFASACAAQTVQGTGAKAADGAAIASPTILVARPAHLLPPPSALEAQYGIQVAHVGLTASGGLVDVRFKVLDAAKAKALLGNAANAPALIAGDKPPLMAPHHALHGARFSNGQVFYILYPNTRSAIQPGVEVLVAMGAARLGPVTAQ